MYSVRGIYPISVFPSFPNLHSIGYLSVPSKSLPNVVFLLFLTTRSTEPEREVRVVPSVENLQELVIQD